MTDTPDSAPSPRRRTRTVLGPGLALAAIAVALSLFVLPTQAARWILAGTLDDLGLEVRGVETVEVDLWGRQLVFGPVEVAEPGSDAPPARVERIGLILSYSALFERRGLTEDAVIDGIALDVSRDAEGRITVNGMDLFGLLQPGAAAAGGTEAGSDGDPWGAGLDAFELRNSRVTFTDRATSGEVDGEAVMEIERLRLEGFRSWDPQTPGRFDLAAQINDMSLSVRGEATPFADRIGFTAETDLDAVSLDKIERFTGPLPLTEGAGTLSASLRQDGSLAPDGSIAVATEGTLSLSALQIGLPDGPRIGFERVSVDLDTEKRIQPDGVAAVSGRIGVSGDRAQLTLASGPEAALESAELRFESLDLRADPDRRLSGSLDLSLTAAGGRGAAGEARLGFEHLDLQAGLMDAAFAPSGSVEGTARLSLTLTAPSLGGETEVQADMLSLNLTEARLRQGEDGLRLRGSAGAEIDALDLRTATRAGPLTAALDRLTLAAETLELDLSDTAGLEAWRMGYGATASALQVDMPGDAPLSVGSERISLEEARIDSDLRIDMGALSLDGTTLSRGDGDRLSAARIALRDAVLSQPAAGVIANLSVSDIRGEAQTADGPVMAQLSDIRLDSLQRGEDGRIGAARIDLRGAEAQAQLQTPWTAGFEGLSLTGLSAEPEAGLVAFDETTLEAFSLQQGSGETLRLGLERLTLARGEAETAPALRLAEIAIAGLSAEVTSAVLDLLPETTVEEPESGDPIPAIWIGRMALDDAAQISVTDARHSPPVVLNTTVEALTIRDFDTEDQDARPQVELDAVLNDFSRLSVTGWAKPLGDRPNFDLTINLTDLSLPTFSPYAARHLGMNLETGTLSAQADGEVVEGTLDAITKLDIRDLGFSTLTPEDRERLSATAGMPVGTAVGLLQDSEGRIELEIPIQGNLDDPQFDLAQVVNRAVGSAITGAAKTALQIVFPPALLITAVEMAASAGPGVSLAPAPFEPGTTDLTEEGRTVVQSLGTLLKQRPKLTVTICGRATRQDLPAILTDAVATELARREAAYADARAAYEAEIEPLIEDGILAEDGSPVDGTAPEGIPDAPAAPDLDPESVAAALATDGGDDLRDRLTALAAERTRIARLDLAERQNVAPGQAAECRPVYDPEDTGPPRLEIQF